MIKIPGNMKSPTVIVIGQGTMTGDEKSNRRYERRMDLLEKKLDEQYKRFTDGGNSSPDFKKLIKKLSSLEEALRKSKSGNGKVKITAKLDTAFDKWFERLEKAIKQAKPRMYPSPS